MGVSRSRRGGWFGSNTNLVGKDDLLDVGRVAEATLVGQPNAHAVRDECRALRAQPAQFGHEIFKDEAAELRILWIKQHGARACQRR